MDETTPQDPTQPNEAVTAPVADAPSAASTPAPAAAAPAQHRFWNRTTGMLVAAGVVGAVLGGGAVAVAAGVRDEGHHIEHRDAGRGMRGPWGQGGSQQFGPQGGMMPGGRQQGGWGDDDRQGGSSQQGDQRQGGQQGGSQQFGPQGGMMQGGQQQGGWGPQGMTRGS